MRGSLRAVQRARMLAFQAYRESYIWIDNGTITLTLHFAGFGQMQAGAGRSPTRCGQVRAGAQREATLTWLNANSFE